jgi:hypothetical protein
MGVRNGAERAVSPRNRAETCLNPPPSPPIERHRVAWGTDAVAAGEAAYREIRGVRRAPPWRFTRERSRKATATRFGTRRGYAGGIPDEGAVATS